MDLEYKKPRGIKLLDDFDPKRPVFYYYVLAAAEHSGLFC